MQEILRVEGETSCQGWEVLLYIKAFCKSLHILETDSLYKVFLCTMYTFYLNSHICCMFCAMQPTTGRFWEYIWTEGVLIPAFCCGNTNGLTVEMTVFSYIFAFTICFAKSEADTIIKDGGQGSLLCGIRLFLMKLFETNAGRQDQQKKIRT